MTQVRSHYIADSIHRAYQCCAELYDDPEAFRPERFLESEYGTKEGVDVSDFRDNFAFGSGRVSTGIAVSYDRSSSTAQRACPGEHIARRSIVRVSIFRCVGLDSRYPRS